MTTLRMFKVHPDVVLPQKQTSQSACFDLAFQGYGKGEVSGFTSMNKPIKRLMHGVITIGPGDRVMVPTGLIMDIPEGYSVRIHARSGASLKQGLVLVNSEGIVDSDYTQEVFVLIQNISDNMQTIVNGERIAQAELVKDERYTIEETASRPGVKSERSGGFGSTGTSVTAREIVINTTDAPNQSEKRGRGRPKKTAATVAAPKRGRGRPRKNATSS